MPHKITAREKIAKREMRSSDASDHEISISWELMFS